MFEKNLFYGTDAIKSTSAFRNVSRLMTITPKCNANDCLFQSTSLNLILFTKKMNLEKL